MTTIALIGPDGAGKSSVVPLAARRLGRPVRVIYMGVNLESSRLMLPTTRIALELKRRRGRKPDMVGATGSLGDTTATGSQATGRRPGREILRGLRLVNWIAEEWFRQSVAWIHERRGRIVLFDRHFFCDYYASDVAGRRPGRPWTSRLHGAMLDRLYPRPDLVILLDAPADVLFARKREGTIASLEQRRQDYLELSRVVDRFAIVDATREMETVVGDVVSVIQGTLAEISGVPSDTASTVRPAAIRDDAG